jgi:hypothetical protein
VWLDQTLLRGPKVALVISQRQFKRALRTIACEGDADSYLAVGWKACTHAFEVAGEPVCIVSVDAVALSRMPPIDAAAVLVHEATHVWQRTRAALGPGDPGEEMEAYALQNIAAALMHAYVRATSSCSSPGSEQTRPPS